MVNYGDIVLNSFAKNIIYNADFRKICKNNTNASILLSQCCYYFTHSPNDDGSFYKFSKPCENRFYQNGDSWCEILGFSEKELKHAMAILKELNFIISKKSPKFDNRTFYYLQIDEIKNALNNLYENTLTNEQKQPVKAKTEPKEYKDTTEQEKTLKSDDLVLKTTQKTEKSEVKTENKGDLVLKTDKKPKQKTELIYNLPHFVDSQIFKDFINHRKEIKKPMTQNAVNATIKKLCDFHAKGYDCNEILNNSIANGWQGIFEPQQNRQNLNANKPLIQRLGEQEARILARYENQNSEMIDCEILEVRQ